MTLTLHQIVLKFIKSRRTRWLDCLICKTEMRDVQNVLFGRLMGRDNLGKLGINGRD